MKDLLHLQLKYSECDKEVDCELNFTEPLMIIRSIGLVFAFFQYHIFHFPYSKLIRRKTQKYNPRLIIVIVPTIENGEKFIIGVCFFSGVSRKNQFEMFDF